MELIINNSFFISQSLAIFFSIFQQVSFADLGWDEYVILPKQYEANFCGGSCTWPFDVLDNTTKHSYIQGVANLENPDLIPPPCCVPQELGVLLVSLQQSPEVVVAKRWEDMVAHSCSCR